jgi:hypothetical protein
MCAVDASPMLYGFVVLAHEAASCGVGRFQDLAKEIGHDDFAFGGVLPFFR